jgi:hypothetical protein
VQIARLTAAECGVRLRTPSGLVETCHSACWALTCALWPTAVYNGSFLTFMTWEVTSVRSDQREQKRMRLHMGATNPFHVYLGISRHTPSQQAGGTWRAWCCGKAPARSGSAIDVEKHPVA